MNHEPLLYRADTEDRHSVPSEVCDTCSDFERGRLVPVSFCAIIAGSAPQADRAADAAGSPRDHRP